MSKKFLYAVANKYTEVEAFETTDYISSSAGVTSAGLPVVLDAAGLFDSSFINVGTIDHGSLAGLGDDDHTIYSLIDGSRAYTGKVSYASHPTFSLETEIVDKKYVDDIVVSSEWYPYSALDYVIDNTLAPATEVNGDVYVLSHDGGTPHADYDGAVAGDIVKFNGVTWDATTPTTGTKVSVDDEPNTAYYLWGGTTWVAKSLEVTTASTGLVKVGNDIRIDATAAGDGLGFSTGILNVNVDDSSIETNADILRVKAGGITDAMLATDYIQTTEVDNATIEFSGSTLNVKIDGINDTHINWGTGATQVSAVDVPIEDLGGYLVSSEVEGALQELALNQLSGQTFTSAGVTKGDLVVMSANDTVDNYSNISTDDDVVGMAASSEASGNVQVLWNGEVITGVISSATVGDIYYWNGSALTTTFPSGAGAYAYQAGVAKNATDLIINIKLVKRNA